MSFDEQLLRRARAEGERLLEAERQAQLARVEYHTAVRRLHLAGASLREIGKALGLSHQRVQQIVDGAGGTWWQRTWRARKVERARRCTFCGHPAGEVAKLLAGPNVYICDACVALAERVVAGDADGGPLALAAGGRARCSFCGKPRSAERPLVTGPANICGDCLRVCRQILDDRAA